MGVFGIVHGDSVRVCEGIFESFVLKIDLIECQSKRRDSSSL